MSREIRGRVYATTPHPTLCGALLVSVIIPGHAAPAIRERMQATLVIPEHNTYSRSADQ
ncbi:hypothetical protein [Arthrobacter sp. VKM Ac-2550]|uniref:hypothetical protein n=1 Tax=Crystallibacter permensis TaxID=1938888 RepID=UPI0022262C8F|nr:hypothetical protein [Arthrobacter sp. VKM Ac-2550]MCW2132911.1 hypothetical protein [Arthrobacter sp. VKM Ac-2550]